MSYVIGFHRSFTSLLASILHDALGSASEDLPSLLPPANDNPLGFFESKDLFNLNNEILQCVGQSWDQPWITPPRQSLIESTLDKHFIDSFLESHPQTYIWTDKDPRLCLTIDVINSLSKFQRPSIGIVRHPFMAARSLLRRNNFNIEKSLLLWILYNYFAFIGNRHRPSIVIDSTDLFNNSKSCCNAILTFLAQVYCECNARPGATIQVPSFQFVFDIIKKRTRPDLAHLKVDLISQSDLASKALCFWEALSASPSLSYQCTDRILEAGNAAYLEAIKSYSSLLDNDQGQVIIGLRKNVAKLTVDLDTTRERARFLACERQVYALQYSDLLINLKELQLEIASIHQSRQAALLELSKARVRNRQLSRVITRLIALIKLLQIQITRLRKSVMPISPRLRNSRFSK